MKLHTRWDTSAGNRWKYLARTLIKNNYGQYLLDMLKYDETSFI